MAMSDETYRLIGMHAGTDGFTSLAVVVGAMRVVLGFPPADPIVGLFISAAIHG